MPLEKQDITQRLVRFIPQYRETHATLTPWGDPLVGIAAAEDPRFVELKAAVGPGHLQPADLVKSACSVVAFFIPLGPETAQSNRQGALASETWARAYVETNALIAAASAHLCEWLEAQGHTAATVLPTHEFNVRTLISDWSHRHVAAICGLGGFGLNNMLITAAGCCGRLGSLVTSLELPADSRPEGEACLFRHDGSCGLCLQRCRRGALHADGFDRQTCYQQCLENEVEHRRLGKADVCGKCLVGLPCTFGDPVRAKAARSGQLRV